VLDERRKVERGKSNSINDYGKWETYLNYCNSPTPCIDAIGINLDRFLGSKNIGDGENPASINFREHQRLNKLIRRINEGTTVRIVIPEIDSPYLNLRAYTEKVDASSHRWKNRLKLNKSILKYIKENLIDDKQKNNYVIKEYGNILYYFLLRSDDLMIVSPYLAYSTGGNSPAYVLRELQNSGEGTSLFSKYYNDFNKIFSDSRQII